MNQTPVDKNLEWIGNWYKKLQQEKKNKDRR